MKKQTPNSEIIATKISLVSSIQKLEDQENIDKEALQQLYDQNNKLNEQYDFFDQPFEENGKKGLKDITGAILVPALYTDFSVRFLYDFRRLSPVPAANAEGKYALVSTDGTGTPVTPFIYDTIGTIQFTPYYFAQKDSKIAVLNSDGMEFIPCIIDKITDNFNGIVSFTSNGKHGLFTKHGLYVAPIYDELSENNEFVHVRLNQHWGYINEEGKFIDEDADDELFENASLLSWSSLFN